jgi:hypothetical protein
MCICVYVSLYVYMLVCSVYVCVSVYSVYVSM